MMTGVADASAAAGAGPLGRLLASARNLVASVLSLGRTRLELLSVEVQLEIRRTAELAVWLVVGVQACMVGLIMTGFLVILLFWDSHRLLSAGLVTAFFFALAGVAALVCVAKVRNKPPMLEGTLSELAKDAARLRGES